MVLPIIKKIDDLFTMLICHSLFVWVMIEFYIYIYKWLVKWSFHNVNLSFFICLGHDWIIYIYIYIIQQNPYGRLKQQFISLLPLLWLKSSFKEQKVPFKISYKFLLAPS